MQNTSTAYNIISFTQPSAAVFRYSMSAADANGNQKVITDWNICKNLLTARAKSLLHTSKKKGWIATVLL